MELVPGQLSAYFLNISITVTRFGKILKHLGNIWRAYLVLGKILNLLWQNNDCYWANFHCCKWPKLRTKSSNLVNLISMHFSFSLTNQSLLETTPLNIL